MNILNLTVGGQLDDQGMDVSFHAMSNCLGWVEDVFRQFALRRPDFTPELAVLAGDEGVGGGGVNCDVDSGASASRVFFSNDSGKGGGSGRRVRSGAMRNDACKVRAGGGEEKSSASATSRLKCRVSESSQGDEQHDVACPGIVQQMTLRCRSGLGVFG